MWRHSVRRVSVVVFAIAMFTIAHPDDATASPTESTTSATTTTVGFELSDDFLVLYPEYDDDQYQYLLPDSALLPQTGPAVRVGLGALALVVFGVAFAVLARGPRRRARADGKASP